MAEPGGQHGGTVPSLQHHITAATSNLQARHFSLSAGIPSAISINITQRQRLSSATTELAGAAAK